VKSGRVRERYFNTLASVQKTGGGSMSLESQAPVLNSNGGDEADKLTFENAA